MASKSGLPKDAKVSEGGDHVEFPTSDLPGTANPNPPHTDQSGVKGMGPKSETGTQRESEAPETPGHTNL